MKLRADVSAVRASVIVGVDTLSVTVPSAGGVRTGTVPLVLPEQSDAAAAVFDSAFADVSARLALSPGRRRLHAHITLLPPHVDVRLIALPPLRRAEAEAVIRRDAARHFVGGTAAKVVAVRLPPRPARRRTDRAPVLAAAAPAQLVEAIRAAAVRAGWRVDRITPAHATWIADAVRNARRSSAGAPIAAVAVSGDTAHLVRLERGAVTLLRRVAVADAPDIAGVLGAGPGAASVFAEGAVAERIERALTAAGWTVIRGPAVPIVSVHAHGADLELLPASVVVEREQRRRTLATRLATAAAVLLVAAAGVHLWGARRELDSVRAQRAALRPQVAPLLETRDSLDRLRERAATLRSLADAPEWTRALFDIALLLPPDAHVVSLRGSGDTLTVSAQGARAGAALQALRGAASLRDVRLQGAVERDLEAGATALERFTLQARVIGADSAADSAAAREGS